VPSPKWLEVAQTGSTFVPMRGEKCELAASNQSGQRWSFSTTEEDWFLLHSFRGLFCVFLVALSLFFFSYRWCGEVSARPRFFPAMKAEAPMDKPFVFFFPHHRSPVFGGPYQLTSMVSAPRFASEGGNKAFCPFYKHVSSSRIIFSCSLGPPSSGKFHGNAFPPSRLPN